MQVIPVSSVPSQTFSVPLSGQAVQISLYTLGEGESQSLYIDVNSNGEQIITGRACKAYSGLPNTVPRLVMTGRRYLGFQGDFVFIDTQASANNAVLDPQYSGLGSRWQLLYLSEADLVAGGYPG